MNDWLRSLTVLAVAFASVVAVMVGLAALIVPSPAPTSQAPGAGGPLTETPAAPNAGGPITVLGGALAVTGDREGTLALTRETTDGRYGLVGSAGRILFEGQPLVVARVQYDGLEFFVDPDECTVTPGERHDPTGVAGAHISCQDIEDVRGNGVLSFDGTLGLAADLLGMRGGLPDAGGTVVVGDETLVFDEARLFVGPQGIVVGRGYSLTLFDTTGDGVVGFDYDPESHELTLVFVGVDEHRTAEASRDACSVESRELGRLNPHTTVAELSITCSELDMVDVGVVSVEGTIVVEESELRH